MIKKDNNKSNNNKNAFNSFFKSIQKQKKKYAKTGEIDYVAKAEELFYNHQKKKELQQQKRKSRENVNLDFIKKTEKIYYSQKSQKTSEKGKKNINSNKLFESVLRMAQKQKELKKKKKEQTIALFTKKTRKPFKIQKFNNFFWNFKFRQILKFLLKIKSHYGSNIKIANPQLKSYIYAKYNDYYIIDLSKTILQIKNVLNFIHKVSFNGGHFMFVGTKLNHKIFVEEISKRTNSLYVSYPKWTGGILTNNRRILDNLENNNKNILYKGLQNYKFIGKPSVIIMTNPEENKNALKEAQLFNIPVISLVDLNNNINYIDYPIVLNNQNLISVGGILKLFYFAIKEGQLDLEKKIKSKTIIKSIQSFDKNKNVNYIFKLKDRLKKIIKYLYRKPLSYYKYYRLIKKGKRYERVLISENYHIKKKNFMNYMNFYILSYLFGKFFFKKKKKSPLLRIKKKIKNIKINVKKKNKITKKL